MRTTTRLPRARVDGLIVKELPEEILVYDISRDKAHCLNLTAAAVWKQCDGRSTAPQIARRIGVTAGESGTIAEEVVWLALVQLGQSNLLEEPVDSTQSPQSIMGMSRREALRRIGIGAAIAIPIVATITAPTPVQAGTCRGSGQSCGTSSQCCSGVCSGGSCLGGPLNRQQRRRSG